MANQTLYTFKANLQDLIKLQQEITKAQVALSKLKKTDAEYQAQANKLKGLQNNFNQTAGAMKKATNSANGLNKAGGKLINTFKSAAVAIAAAFAVRAIVGGVRSIIETFSEFEAQMAAVKAISGATAEEFRVLEGTALRLGASTVFTATQVAQLQEEFARLGFSVKEIDAATESTLDLAAATGESLAKSAQIAGSTLRAFGLDAELTRNVTDIMAASFTSSALNLDKFTESMKFVAPVARSVGFTLEETTAVLANLSNNGISGSIAGNSLKNILLRLGDANSKLAKKLGGPVQGIPELAQAMRKLADEGFTATDAVELLDKRSAPAFLALIKNIEGLEDSVGILNDAEGAVTKMAAIRLDTLQGDFTILKSAAEGLNIAIGEQFDVGLRNIIYSLTNFTQSITESELALKSIRTVVQILGVALTTLSVRFAAMGLVALYKNAILFTRGIRLMTIQIQRATTAQAALNAVTKANPFVAIASVVGALAGAYFLLGEEASEAEMKQRRLNDALATDIADLASLEIGSKKRAEQMRKFKDDYGDILGLIDIELATQKELNELKELNIKQEEDRIELADKQSNVERLEEEIVKNKELVAAAQARIDKEREQLANLTRTAGQASNALINGAMREVAKTQKIIDDQIQRQKDLATERAEVKELKNQLSEELALTEAYQRLKLDGEDTYREKRRDFYNKQLEDFRKFKGDERAVAMKSKFEEFEAELKIISDYQDARAAEQGLSGEPLEQAKMQTQKFAEMAKAMGVDVNVSTEEITKMNIELTVLRDFIIKMNNAFIPATKSAKDFGDTIAGFRLNKTQDQFKKLAKLMDDILDNQFTRMEKESESKTNAALEANSREMDLMKTNQTNLEKLQVDGSKKELAALIKANRNKYDTIKNLTVEAYNDAIDGENGNKAEMLKILQSMYDEEARKLETAQAYETELTNSHNANMDRIASERKFYNDEAIFESETAQLRSFKRSELNFFAALKKEKEIRDNFAEAQIDSIKENRDRELANLDTALEKGLISDAQYAQDKIELERKTATEIENIRQDALDADVEAQVVAIQKIGEYYNQAFSAFSTFFSNKMALEKQETTEFYDLQAEDLAHSLERELEATEGNSEAQEDIRQQYALREEINEQKKQDALRKIAKKEFMVQKLNDIVMATINGAVAITKVAGQTGIGAIAAAPLMSALVGAQIAAIAAQKFVGEQGGIIPDDMFAKGGMVVGPSHADGGVKFNVGGRVAELEGGEAVINKRSTAMFRSQLSAMNQAGGGVAFASGGIMPGTSNTIQASSVNNTQMQFDNLAENIISGINSKEVIVTEGAISSSQESVAVTELTSSIF